MDAKSYGEAFDGIKSDIALTTLDRADISSMESGSLSQLLLRKAHTEAELPEILSKNESKIFLFLSCHDGRMAACRQRIYRL